jgi:hypothetical protein
VPTHIEAIIRYLTKLCDQVVCLVSEEYSNKLVWKSASNQVALDDDENIDRLYSFEVFKTNEQDESVNWRVGFEVSRSFRLRHNTTNSRPQISDPVMHVNSSHGSNSSTFSDDLKPRLLAGETRQAFITSRLRNERKEHKPLPRRIHSFSSICGSY